MASPEALKQALEEAETALAKAQDELARLIGDAAGVLTGKYTVTVSPPPPLAGGAWRGGALTYEDTRINDVTNIGDLIKDDRAPMNFASSEGVNTLLNAQPASASAMRLTDNPAYLLSSQNYEYVDPPLRGGGGGATWGEPKKMNKKDKKDKKDKKSKKET